MTMTGLQSSATSVSTAVVFGPGASSPSAFGSRGRASCTPAEPSTDRRQEGRRMGAAARSVSWCESWICCKKTLGVAAYVYASSASPLSCV
ncbi:hypothetical protein BE11_25290 [Sorangium cellulosum]|nr:hypothetical protein BE11_25290 [Sorangium cellulosum]